MSHRGDEAQIIAAARQGDNDAWTELYNRYHYRIKKLCLKIVKNPADAEELTQDTFLQVFRKFHLFKGDSAFYTWLYRVAVRQCLMKLRKGRRPMSLKEIPLEDVLAEYADGSKDGTDALFSVRDLALDGVVDRMALKRYISELPPGYREVFILRFVHGFEFKEIAAITGTSIGNIKSQSFRAKAKLQKSFSAAAASSRA